MEADKEDSLFEDDGASVAQSEVGADPGAAKGENGIAKKESRVVSLVRFLVVLLLIGVTIGAAVAVYFYVSNAETSAFREDYEDSSNKLFDAVGSAVDESLGAIDNLMISLVSHQKETNTSWPFVTISDFAIKGTKILTLSRASEISVFPRVLHDQRAQWETYSVAHDSWVEDSLELQAKSPYFKGTKVDGSKAFPLIHSSNGVSEPQEIYYPRWQASPVVPQYRGAYNWNLYAAHSEELNEVELGRAVIMGPTINLPEPKQDFVDWISDLIGPGEDPRQPVFPFYYPIVANATDAVFVSEQGDPEGHPVVGVIAMTIFWSRMMENILSSEGLVVVVGNTCNQTMTFQINGAEVDFLGNGDLHNEKYNYTSRFAYLHDLGQYSLRGRQYSGFPLSTDYCPYWMKTYPSDTMKDNHETKAPLFFTLAALCIFFFTSAFFLAYDCVSERRQKKVLQVAVQSTAVVANLFPRVVRDRIFPKNEKTKQSKPKERIETAKLRLQQFLRNDDDGKSRRFVNKASHVTDENEGENASNNAPIAELFSETTVMFCDIAGFTAWSSVREPAQVFTLLETLYGAYDRVATRRGVFKVETIGDSYVAVAGLPEPRPDHAVVMAKFAGDVRERTSEVVKQLGRTLGPDTADLEIRIGLNSGPVTAGVLRGERSRFQLFGDTVNTAARMESSGIPSKIHMSESTATLLQKAGKLHWVVKRRGEVEAKGLGRIQTFWLEPVARQSFSEDDDEGADGVAMVPKKDEKTHRLVEWNVEITEKLLKQIVARRATREAALAHQTQKRRFTSDARPFLVTTTDNSADSHTVQAGTVLDEVREVIMLPAYDPNLTRGPSRDLSKIELSESVSAQLRDYIHSIASMYRHDNPFHNFEHASHVTMSVVKLLSRIVAPSDSVVKTAEETDGPLDSTLHDHTYGITSDPLTQFACVFSALIHDVDHPGIPNAQLVKENSPLVAFYKGKSLAEQNSVDIAWRLLVEDQFAELRNLICASKSEMARFRQLVVNGVMATDIMDKDLKKLRNERWDKAFSEQKPLNESAIVSTNRKATIVIEHLIQASDVAHTMQHWHIFRKWNERLFEEMYVAYKQGRAEKNPADFWYKGEMGFFDFYIIPLAKKLSDCGVFGVSSDEYLSYAKKNREEWENRGQEVVETMIAKFKNDDDAPTEVNDKSSEEKIGAVVDVAASETRRVQAK